MRTFYCVFLWLSVTALALLPVAICYCLFNLCGDQLDPLRLPQDAATRERIMIALVVAWPCSLVSSLVSLGLMDREISRERQ